MVRAPLSGFREAAGHCAIFEHASQRNVRQLRRAECCRHELKSARVIKCDECSIRGLAIVTSDAKRARLPAA